ncbi:MAG: glycosyltransferase [Candidatus Omnitrophica bacterium]|nr:glycosyltransferase [Candidatus Omnitrophota bacterium]
MKKIHIMHIQESLEVGGMENGIVNLVNYLDKDLFSLSLCCLNKEGEFVKRVDKSRIKIFCLHQREGFSINLFDKIKKLILKEKVDIVHTHNYYSGLYGIIASKLAGTPVIIHGEHGTLVLSQLRRLWAMRFLSRLVDKFFVVSASLKKELISKISIPENKIDVLINGVDTEKFSPISYSTIRDELGISPETFVFGSVGRLVPIKNLRLLIEAKKKLDQEEVDTKCIIIGDGPCKKELERYAQQIKTEIIFLGERNNMPLLYPIFDIFVLVSLSEGMSNTILEAMACGKPVIATHVGGNKEIVEENKTGFLIAPNDLDDLLTAIKKCINDRSLIKQLGQNARESVLKKFSLQSMIKAYERRYLEIARQKRIIE